MVDQVKSSLSPQQKASKGFVLFLEMGMGGRKRVEDINLS